MTNLYRHTATALVATPPLRGEARVDVVVIGGGLTGLSSALHLAEGGAKVAVLEAEEVAWGASGRNGGQVNPGLKFDPDIVERDFGPDLGGRMNACAGAGPTHVFDLIERHGIRCESRQNGTLRAAIAAKHSARVRATAEQFLRRGAPVEVLDAAETERATGTRRYSVAMLDRRGGDLNPLSFARGIARAAVAAGATVHGGSRVRRLERKDGKWHALTESGSLWAEHAVVATNGYTDDLWPELRRTVVPLFGAIAATAPLPEVISKGIMPSRAVLYESGAITVYYRVDCAGRLLIGGRGPNAEVTHPESIPYLLDYARKLWPQLSGVQWTHGWGGRLAMTLDHYPHVHEPQAGLLMSLGYNGRGVALGTSMGALIARRIMQPSAPFDMPISGVKPIRLHPLWPLAVRAAILRGRATDFLDSIVGIKLA